MEPSLFIKGFIIGFSIAAPVGPIGILCIQRTLSGGNLQGLVSGLGAATADALYGFIAAFGLTFISNAAGADGFGGKQHQSLRVWNHLFSNAYQPDDDPVFCRHICRSGDRQ